MACKTEQASHLYEVDHLAKIVFFLKQAQYQIHVESHCCQQVDYVNRAPKEVNPVQQAQSKFYNFMQS